MRVHVDENAGFCAGVERAIKLIESELGGKNKLFSIGPVIHNPNEVERLSERGLKTIDQDQVISGDSEEISNQHVLIRTHGISERIKNYLDSICADVTDATCPNVKNVQQIVKQHCSEGYQILIVGKKAHPEVAGLVGHCENGAIILESIKDIDHRINMSKKTLLIAQTTISQKLFYKIESHLKDKIENLVVKDTTCRSVRNRQAHIEDFALSHDIIIFVAGKNSSNSRELYTICKTKNKRIYWIEDENEVRENWFEPDDEVGVTGGASTPNWLLQKVAHHIENLLVSTSKNIY